MASESHLLFTCGACSHFCEYLANDVLLGIYDPKWVLPSKAVRCQRFKGPEKLKH